jgi:N-acetylglutamate synthase-like GNAT family acetyltransferase
MRYRAAEASDFRAIQGLLHQLNPDGGALKATAEEWDRVLQHPGTTVFLAEDSAPVACVTLHILPNMTYRAAPYGLIENVVTRHDQRGKGIGRGLMDHVLSQAEAAGCYKVMLLTGVDRGAQVFYRACGFSDSLKTGMVLYRNHPDAAKWQRGE